MEPFHLTDPAIIKAAMIYNRAADHFDDALQSTRSQYGRQTVARLGLQPGAMVLDLGCGTGTSALLAAEVVGSDGVVIGVDLAEKLLEQARAKAAQRDLTNIVFRLGDMTALGYPDGCFDAAISVFSMFFVPDMEAAVRELWRMVKLGGKLAITIWGPNRFEPIYTVWREVVRAERPDLYMDFNPWDRITSPDQLRQILKGGGVVDAEIVSENGSQVLQSPQDWWTIVLGSGLRGTIEAMDSAAAARIREQTVSWIRDNRVQSIETNVIYAVATKC
jgi:SAM-dependent methyltransferase